MIHILHRNYTLPRYPYCVYTFSFGIRLLIVWGIWNALVPQLTSFEPISILQVVGLMVLVYFLHDRPKFHIKTNREMYYTPGELAGALDDHEHQRMPIHY